MNKNKCPNCNGILLKIYLDCKYAREDTRIHYLEPTTNCNYIYACIDCPYAKGEKWKKNL